MKRLPLFLAFVFGLCFGNHIVAKGWAPGELFIAGPDISPDSSDYIFLYFSPDGGHTLEIRDTFAYPYPEVIIFAVDAMPNIMYMNDVIGCFHRSTDGGVDWELVYSNSSLASADIKAGVNVGEVVTVFQYSLDFGSTWLHSSGTGWHGYAADFEEGIGSEIYQVNTEGILFVTYDRFDTMRPIYDFGTRVSLFRGVVEGEIYALLSYEILLSRDGGISFDTVGSISDFVSSDFSYELISGWTEGEIYCVGIHYNEIPMHGVYGGSIVIYHSTDYGSSWELVARHEAGIEEQRVDGNGVKIFPSPFGDFLYTNIPVTVYDISGREVARGEGKLDLSGLKPGIFFVKWERNGKTFAKKILKLK